MTITLYAAQTQLTHQHQPVLATEALPSTARARRVIYIRAVITSDDLDDALGNARLLPGETVLNSIPESW